MGLFDDILKTLQTTLSSILPPVGVYYATSQLTQKYPDIAKNIQEVPKYIDYVLGWSPTYNQVKGTIQSAIQNTTKTATTQGTGTLIITANVDSVKVYVNNKEVGTVPPALTLTLPVGTYTIYGKKEGYTSKTYMTTLVNNDVVRVELQMIPTTTTPTKAKVTIATNPPDGMIYVNGEYKGISPVTITLPAGTYRIVAAKEGFDPAIRDNVVLVAGKEYYLVLTLKKSTVTTMDNIYSQTVILTDDKSLTGVTDENKVILIDPGNTINTATLKIATDPKGAEVYLGDKSVGYTPISITTYSGTYKVTIKKEGYKTVEKNVTLVEGETKELKIALEKETMFDIITLGILAAAGILAILIIYALIRR